MPSTGVMKSVKAVEVATPPAYFNFNMNETKEKMTAQKEVRASQMFYQPQKQLKPQSLDQLGQNAEEFQLSESPKVKVV